LRTSTPVTVYGLFQCAMRSDLILEHFPETAGRLLVKLGESASSELCWSALHVNLGFHAFIREFQAKLKSYEKRETKG
jgi:hypothetical protein